MSRMYDFLRRKEAQLEGELGKEGLEAARKANELRLQSRIVFALDYTKLPVWELTQILNHIEKAYELLRLTISLPEPQPRLTVERMETRNSIEVTLKPFYHFQGNEARDGRGT